MDSIYVRDAAVVCDRGVILCNMGKPQREGEPAAMEAALRASGCEILGTIQPPGRLEGGDVAWLDERTIAVGHGYRTNAEGIEQLRSFLGDSVEDFVIVPLPHWRGVERRFSSYVDPQSGRSRSGGGLFAAHACPLSPIANQPRDAAGRGAG